MTTPQPPVAAPPAPATVPPEPQATENRPQESAVPEPGQQGAWPPDDETLMQLQMAARFSIIDEPADDSATTGADQSKQPSVGAQPPPQPERQG